MALLALALGIGASIRFWKLTALGFNSDEAVYSGQAASIAGDADLSPYFPVFRAHPLLYQTVLSFGYVLRLDPMVGRIASVVIGLATIYMTYKVGRVLYGPKIGGISALILAVMPYHVLVTRQVLLDGPMAFFAACALFCLAKYADTYETRWLYATGACMGLVFLSKEPGILFFGAIFVFFALTPRVPVTVSRLAAVTAVMILVMLPYPASLFFAERSGTTGQFITWQLFRRPNHEWSFYFTELPHYVGPLLLVVVAIGILACRRNFSWRESLLLSWIIVPTAFFALWQVKGFQYLLPASIPLCILGARFLVWLPLYVRYRAIKWGDAPVHKKAASRIFLSPVSRSLGPVLVTIVVVSLTATSCSLVNDTNGQRFLAGTGGVPGGRETGEWIRENVPEGAQILTIGPSMANILQFYGDRKAYGLSVSTNPLHRNPVYEPVPNPDFLLRTSQLQYIVWDSYSASRSQFFSDKILDYKDRYNGRVVFTANVEGTSEGGDRTSVPVIIVFEVRP